MPHKTSYGAISTPSISYTVSDTKEAPPRRVDIKRALVTINCFVTYGFDLEPVYSEPHNSDAVFPRKKLKEDITEKLLELNVMLDEQLLEDNLSGTTNHEALLDKIDGINLLIDHYHHYPRRIDAHGGW